MDVYTQKFNEVRLLLTVARILRAHIASMGSASYRDEDLAHLDEALEPWAPSKAEPVNEAAAPPSNPDRLVPRRTGYSGTVGGYTHDENGGRL